jgi:hypothetical protein
MAGESKFQFGPDRGNAGQTTIGEGEQSRVDGPKSDTFTFGSQASGSALDPAHASAPIAKRRGRPSLPRDASGAIIRDANTSPSTGKEKAGVGVKGFVKNDRAKLEQQITGIHAAASVLTKQSVFALQPVEAKGLTSALSDVLDYHEINLTEAGGVGGLYLALALTVYGIYKPRLDFIKNGGKPKLVAERATRPATAGDAAFVQRPMDFTADGGAAPIPATTLDLEPSTLAAASQTPIRFN